MPSAMIEMEEADEPPDKNKDTILTIVDDQKSFDAAAVDIPSVLEYFRTSREGLTSEEAERRLHQYGRNELEKVSVNPVLKFLLYLWNPFSWSMETALLLALILSDFGDAALIFTLLMVNASIGYWEEASSSDAVAVLQSQLAPVCLPKRDGNWVEIPAGDLVPGDVVKLSIGKVVPADCKLLDGDPVTIDQSGLTGESLPVTKYPGEEVYSGSMVKSGEIDAVVYATGAKTFFGKAAGLVQATEEQGHFQAVLKKIGYFCISFIIVWVAIELIVQFGVRQKPCLGVGEGQCSTLSNTLVLIVGGIPVAMPTVLSVTMAIGAASLAKKEAVVTRLTAIEELAGMDILCSDKTGTLTLNQLQVSDPICLGGASPHDVLMYAGLASQSVVHDAIDEAILAAQESPIPERYQAKQFIPFDPVSKKTEATIFDEETNVTFKVRKGAPQVILQASSNSEVVEEGMRQIEELASRGYRALGVAVCHDERYWITLGLIPLFDPPRHDTADTIAHAQELGIQVKMITGDQLAIAKETARLLRMGDCIYDAKELSSSEEAATLIEKADGFAGVFPEDKHKVVTTLQREMPNSPHHVVGMTGDGVNDAPALKKADIGIAVADATDAARAASDIVLLSPGLGVIISAILCSRKIFQRMQSYSIYSISTTIRIVLTFGLLTVVFDYEFLPLVIAVMAILNDGAVLTISTDNVTPSQSPDRWDLKSVFIMSSVFAVWQCISSLLLFVLVKYTTAFEMMGLMFLNDV